ncbi:hypothetical protein [Streptosporangium sp. OZ121]|uniref:hypothetical protein n=1 Tax=Streptosporangium sp. OZ121 TaxID=3444183 RepID=UPI003F7A7617
MAATSDAFVRVSAKIDRPNAFQNSSPEGRNAAVLSGCPSHPLGPLADSHLVNQRRSVRLLSR